METKTTYFYGSASHSITRNFDTVQIARGVAKRTMREIPLAHKAIVEVGGVVYTITPNKETGQWDMSEEVR